MTSTKTHVGKAEVKRPAAERKPPDRKAAKAPTTTRAPTKSRDAAPPAEAKPRGRGATPVIRVPECEPLAAGAQSTRNVILQHAARLLRQNGYAAVSLRQIAAEANIKAGSIYYHFESKEEILHHVLEEGLRVIVQEVNKATAKLPPGTPFRERLRVVVRSHLHGLLQVNDFSSANIRIYGQVPREVRDRHYVARRAFADWWDEFLAQAVAEGVLRPTLNLSVVRVFIVGALNWTVEWYDPKQGSFDKLADNLHSIIADGLVSE